MQCSEQVALPPVALLPTAPCAVRPLGDRGPKAPLCVLQGNRRWRSVPAYKSTCPRALASSAPEKVLQVASPTNMPPGTGHCPVAPGHLAKTTFNTIAKTESLLSPHLEGGRVHSPRSRNSPTICPGRTRRRVPVQDPGSAPTARRPRTCSCLCAAAVSSRGFWGQTGLASGAWVTDRGEARGRNKQIRGGVTGIWLNFRPRDLGRENS